MQRMTVVCRPANNCESQRTRLWSREIEMTLEPRPGLNALGTRALVGCSAD